MNPSRFVLAVVVGCCLLAPKTSVAADTAPPFAMDKSYSTDQTITLKDGTVIQSKSFVDGDKMRSNVVVNGMAMSTIVRKDKQKIYQVMDAQKMAMEMDYDPNKFMKGRTAAAFGPQGTFELIGPDTVDGVACTKYKVTSDQNKQVFFFWLDVANKRPMQMADADGSFTVKWKNYKTGPQDASLFEVPAGYQIIPMAGMPGMPGGAPAPGGNEL